MPDDVLASAAAAAAAAPVEVRALKYDRRVHRRWTATLVEQTATLIVVRGVFDEPVQHALLGLVEAGTVSTEYYWTDRWYSVFKFVTPAGALRNYYCNIHLPPTFERQVLSFVDLDIDLLVAPNLTYQVLDEDEFETNRVLLGYPEEVVRRARHAVDELIALVNARRFPFPPRP